jgi:peptide/nickel transport system substrate-binding protein
MRALPVVPLLVAVIVLAGCQGGPPRAPAADPGAPAQPPPAAAEQPRRGGTLTAGLDQDISSMNPFLRTFGVDQLVREVMYDSLVAYDDAKGVVPNLAESWQVSDDGKLYTFRLRPGVQFHNGQELTAEDAVWSLSFILEPKNGAYGRNRATMIERAETVDKYTLRVGLKQPSPGFLAAMSDIKVGLVVPAGSLEEGVQQVASFPPGTGPFRFVEWQPRQRVVFDRFDAYWGAQKALIDRLVYRPILDESVRLNALRAGDVDMLRGAPPEWMKQIKEGQLSGITVLEGPLASNKRLAFNVVGSPFEDPKLRLALAHAINKDEIVQGVFFGFADPVENQSYPRGTQWYLEGVPTIRHDLDRASALLREAGYTGQQLEILLGAESEDTRVASVVQGQARRVGMDLRLRPLDSSAREDLARRGEYHVDVRGFNFDADPSTNFDADFRCDERRVSNRTGYCDRETDALLDRAAVEPDVARRKELLKQVLIRSQEAVVYIPLVFVHKPYALRNYVKGFSTERIGRWRWLGGGVNTIWLDR